MQAYSQDLRDRVLGALERGESPTAIAERFEVSRVWVYQVKKRLEQSGLRMSLPIGGHRVSRVAALEEQVRGWIAQEPDLTLAELCQRLQSENGIHLKAPALWHQLNKWGLSNKKKHCAPASKNARMCAWHASTGSKASATGKPQSSSFWMKPASPPTWRVAMVARRKAGVAWTMSPTAIGKPTPSSRPCVMTPWKPPGS